MAALLTPSEKAELLKEAGVILQHAKLNDQEKIVTQMLSGASSGYRYSIAEVCAILRTDTQTVTGLQQSAEGKIGAGNVARLGEIANMLTADFPERE